MANRLLELKRKKYHSASLTASKPYPGTCYIVYTFTLGKGGRQERFSNKFILTMTLALVSVISTGDYEIRGEGNFSCPDYVAAKQTNNAKLYSSISWVQGFMTGVNYQAALPCDSSSFIGQDLTAVSLVDWIENYCRDNPQDYLADAAEALVVEFREKN